MYRLFVVLLSAAILTTTACSWQVLAYPTASPGPATALEPNVGATGWSRDPPGGYQFSLPRLETRAAVCVNPSGGPSAENLVEAVSQAIAIWRSSAPGIPIESTGTCNENPVSGDGMFVVGWGPLVGTTVGWTQWRLVNGARSEFDITIDSSDPDMNRWDCLLRVVLHEFGHAMGLAHQNDQNSVMYPTLDCNLPILPGGDAQAAWSLYG